MKSLLANLLNLFNKEDSYIINRKNEVINEYKSSDVIFLSFPKSGRTWIRFFLAKYIQLNFKKNFDLELKYDDNFINIGFSHNFFDIDKYQDTNKTPKVIFKNELKNKKLIFVIRDPRDVVVSYYHHKVNRDKAYEGSIDAFIKSNTWGIERQSQFVLELIDFYNSYKGEKLLIFYNDLSTDPNTYFKKIVEFIFLKVNSESLKKAIHASEFENMRKHEVEISNKNEKEQIRMGVKSWNGNENALKVRKGKVGSYKEELSEETIEYIEKLMHTQKLIDFISQNIE